MTPRILRGTNSQHFSPLVQYFYPATPWICYLSSTSRITDAEPFEKLQKLARTFVEWLRHVPYEAVLQQLRLFSLTYEKSTCAPSGTIVFWNMIYTFISKWSLWYSLWSLLCEQHALAFYTQCVPHVGKGLLCGGFLRLGLLLRDANLQGPGQFGVKG